MARRTTQREALITNTATSVHAGVRVTDFNVVALSIIGSATANMKIFVKGSIGDTRPDFKVATNVREAKGAAWDYLDVIDLEDNASIDGDTGIDLSGNRIRNIEVNTNLFDWLSVHSTAVVAGTVTVAAVMTTTQ